MLKKQLVIQKIKKFLPKKLTSVDEGIGKFITWYKSYYNTK